MASAKAAPMRSLCDQSGRCAEAGRRSSVVVVVVVLLGVGVGRIAPPDGQAGGRGTEEVGGLGVGVGRVKTGECVFGEVRVVMGGCMRGELGFDARPVVRVPRVCNGVIALGIE